MSSSSRERELTQKHALARLLNMRRTGQRSLFGVCNCKLGPACVFLRFIGGGRSSFSSRPSPFTRSCSARRRSRRACSTAELLRPPLRARWSSLILKTTGCAFGSRGSSGFARGRLCLRLQPSEHLRYAGDLCVAFISAAVIAKESLARFPVLGWHLRRGRPLFVDRRHPDAPVFCASGARSSRKGCRHDLRRGHAQWRRTCVRFKGGSFLLAIEAGLPSCRSRCRDAAGDAERPPANRAGRRRLVVHDPIQPPALEAPTPRDAKALALVRTRSSPPRSRRARQPLCNADWRRRSTRPGCHAPRRRRRRSAWSGTSGPPGREGRLHGGRTRAATAPAFRRRSCRRRSSRCDEKRRHHAR